MSRGAFQFDVVVAGGGFGGIYTAKRLLEEKRRRGKLEVAVIAEHNYMVFQPMLAEVCGSSIQSNHVVSPIRRLCRGADVLRGSIQHIDLPGRCLWLRAGDFAGELEVGFEHLVLALGSVVDLSRVPGMPEHAYLMKSAGDALQLRAAVIDRLEEANLMTDAAAARKLLTFVVVGGGFSGVETAGQILDLLQAAHRFYERVDAASFRVLLVHGGEFLLPEINEKLGRYCQDVLRRRGLEVVLEDRVTAMTGTKVYLRSGRVIESVTVVSTVGNAPHPLVVRLAEQAGLETAKGRVSTDEFLRVKGQERFWAVGDCAAVPAAEGGLCPPTAQFALRQGWQAGENISRWRRGKPLKPFRFKGFGSAASIGHRKAVADLLGFRFSGFIAWVIWRTIYLIKLPTIDRKLRVLIDWTLDLLFPRDIALLHPDPTPVYQEMHFQQGDWVFQAGDPAESLYVIKSGRVELSEKQRLIKSLGAGEHFGERALLDDEVWRLDAAAVEPSVLVAVNSKFFRTFSDASVSMQRLMERSALQYLPEQQIRRLVRRISPAVQERRIEELMSSEVASLRPESTVAEALEILKSKCHNSLPLLDEQGRPSGLIEQEDLLEALKASGFNLEAPVSRFRTRPAPVLPRTRPVSEALAAMVRAGARKTLVVDENQRLVGILSLLDLFPPDGEKARAPVKGAP